MNDSDENNLSKLLDAENVGVEDLDTVIYFIKARLVAILPDKRGENTPVAGTTSSSDRVKSWIKCGCSFLEKVLDSAQKISFKILTSENRKAVIDILKGIDKIHWIVVGLGALAYVLDQIDKVYSNWTECIQVLRYMCGLAEQIKLLHEHDFNKEKLIDVVAFIVNGSYFCLSKIKSQKFSQKLSRFLYASSNTEKLKSFKERSFQIYLDLALDGILRLLDLNVSLPPSMGVDPKAVGIEVARDEVVKLLDLKDHSIRSVVLYGLGGIGKSTLATAVCFSPNLDLSGYKCCRINIEHDCSESHVKQLQEQILWDLFDQRIRLRNSTEGENHLFKLFREAISQPVFLFIDNALRGSDVTKFLPEDLSCLPERSRILITIRNGVDMIGKGVGTIEEGGVIRCSYRVKSLSDAASIELLRRKALGSVDKFFERSMNIDGLVKICGGVPFVLNEAGSKLRQGGNNDRACESTIQHLKDIRQTDNSYLCKKVVDEVLNNLGEDLYKDAFLDIAAFFNNWDERMVGYIVGDVALQAIKDAALVMTEKGKVIVDGIVLARGRKFSENDRITDHSGLQHALLDEQRLKRLKGIWLPTDDSHKIQLQAKHLKSMERSVRVLHLSERNKLDGESTYTFTNLKLLHIAGDLRMELLNFEKLAVLQAHLKKCDGLSDSSCLLNFPGCHLSRIEELSLSSSSGSLPESFLKLEYLRFLEIVDCSKLTSLPEKFGDLSSLETLNLSGSRLKSLPDSFGQLSCLVELNLSECRELKNLPQSFSDLSRLEKLNISNCEQLSRLPDGFSDLSRLEKLNISNCEQLSRLPDGFSKLQNLTYLNMAGCSNLEMTSEDFNLLSSICARTAPNCSRLHGKAMDNLVASASVSVDKKGKKQVEDPELAFSVSGKGEGSKAAAGFISYHINEKK